MKIGSIVEGHGEVAAVPVLLRRLLPHLGLGYDVEVQRPRRLSRGRIAKEFHLKRTVDLVARSLGSGDLILTVFDADAECPRALAGRVKGWAEEARRDRLHSVVVAKQEFESWLLGGIGPLLGTRGLPADPPLPRGDPEELRSPKSWFHQNMPSGYSETIDQPAFAATFDIDDSRRRCPSFDKLCRDLSALT